MTNYEYAAEISINGIYKNSLKDTTILYFKLGRDLFFDLLGETEYPDAEGGELSVEFSTTNPSAYKATVRISPSERGVEYDWKVANDLLSFAEIEALIG